MNISDTIIRIGENQNQFTLNEVLHKLSNKFSRPYILQFINELIEKNKIVKSGSTKNAVYALVENAGKLKNIFRKRFKNQNLKEHEILDEILSGKPFLKDMKENVKSIFEYAFTEMVNNVIDHSKSQYMEIMVEKNKNNIHFMVNDFGIGVFKNIMQKRKLHSELEAIQDLLKGKVTTQPHAHSGEGIFFTSKVADIFELESFGYDFRVDNCISDIFIGELDKKKKGTKVSFIINVKSERHLNDIFAKYQTDPDEYAFDKTEIKVKLYTMGSIYISRSQAKRVLSGLEKFRSIILDFDNVPGIGQAFADEIFRVFQSKHPEITISPTHMNDAVNFMVKRVQKP